MELKGNSVTVGQLIEALQTCQPDAQVLIWDAKAEQPCNLTYASYPQFTAAGDVKSEVILISQAGMSDA